MTLTLNHGRCSAAPPPMISASAICRFGKYKEEEPAITRQGEICGNMLDELRCKRDLLRSMTPEQAMSVIEFHKDLTVFDALDLAKKEVKLIVPNFVHDRILTGTKDANSRYANYPARTGTMVIYPALGKPFGEKIVFSWERAQGISSISFDVPVKFRGRAGCALVIEHPDFDVISTGQNAYELIADAGWLHLHEKFQETDGKYGLDERFRLPTGRVKTSRETGRRSWRSDGDYIGLVARGDYDCGGYYGRRGVDLGNAPSDAFGVALF